MTMITTSAVAVVYSNRQRIADELAWLDTAPADPSAAEIVALFADALGAVTIWHEAAEAHAFLAEHHEHVPARVVERAEAVYDA